MRTKLLIPAVMFLAGVVASCTGKVGEPNQLPEARGTAPGNEGNAGGNTDPATMPPDPNTPADPNAAGLMPLRRLNRLEYNNTVRDLLNDKTRPADSFPLDQEQGFIYRRASQVAELDAERLREAAEKLAATADTGSLAPCSGGDEAACARTFVQTFGLRAYRRPPVDEEITRLMDLYQVGRTTLMLDYAGAVKLLIEAMLQSPGFVYRWELGPQSATMEGSVVRLGPYEVASRMSYFLWRTMPDPKLFEAAAANQLTSDADVESQARRMLADDKAHDGIDEFFLEWLGLNGVAERPKDATVYPEWNDALKTAMGTETRDFVQSVVIDGDGRLETLLTANFSFVTQPLASVYDVSAAGATAQKTTLDSSQRSGILTQAGFLTLTGATDGSNPVKRGRKVYERLLCGVLPNPPPNVPPPKPASAGGTTRERFSEHDQQECAKGCHLLMDPIGFAFEHYDGIGRYRDMDNGKPVNSASTIDLDGKKQSFNDAVELTKLLAASDEVRKCFVTQWARYAFSRLDSEADKASIQSAAGIFAQGNYAIRELLVGVATSRSFRYRSPAAGEM